MPKVPEAVGEGRKAEAPNRPTGSLKEQPPRRIVIGGRHGAAGLRAGSRRLTVAELVLRPLASGQRPPAGTFLELFPHKKDTFALPKYFNSNNSKFQQKFSNG